MLKDNIEIHIEYEDDVARFFAIGIKDKDDKFSGIIHDYTGGGSYEEEIVLNNLFLDSGLEWDENESRFNEYFKGELTIDDILAALYGKYELDYDTTMGNYVPMHSDKAHREIKSDMRGKIPYGLGNTFFKECGMLIESE